MELIAVDSTGGSPKIFGLTIPVISQQKTIVNHQLARLLKNIHMATQYPFASQPQNRRCFGEYGEKVDPCPDFPCIHTPCHDPDYLADIEDSCRDDKYHLRLWSNYRKANPLNSVLYKDEESRRKYEEARRRETED